jgi:hypothetical protein
MRSIEQISGPARHFPFQRLLPLMPWKADHRGPMSESFRPEKVPLPFIPENENECLIGGIGD